MNGTDQRDEAFLCLHRTVWTKIPAVDVHNMGEAVQVPCQDPLQDLDQVGGSTAGRSAQQQAAWRPPPHPPQLFPAHHMAPM